MTDLASRPHTLYRFFNAKNELLYVGVTCDAISRWTQHAGVKTWWPEVARTTVEHFPDRQSVMAAETVAIKTEKPKYNIRQSSSAVSSRKPVEDQCRLADLVDLALDPGSLVGSWCHSGADPGWQGVVVAEPSSGVYLVQLFKWMLGERGVQVLVGLSDMKDWQFYDTGDNMRWEYEYGGLRERWAREREERKPDAFRSGDQFVLDAP